MSRPTIQCIGTSTNGRSESKGSLATQLNTVNAGGEPAPNESIHSKSRAVARTVLNATGKDQKVTKTTRSPKAKLHGTGEHAISPALPHKDETESGCRTVKQPGSDAQFQPPASTGSACQADVLRQASAAPRPAMVVTEQHKEQVNAPSASRTTRGECDHSSGTSDIQAQLQRDQRPSEEEEEEEVEYSEGPVHTAPLELLAEFLKAVMEKDYPLSQKLCQMILIYEPENPEAKVFMPLIEERLLIAQEAEEQRGQDDTGCSSEEEDDNPDDDDDDDDDGDEHDDDSDDSEEQTDNSESSSSSSPSSEEDSDELEEEKRVSEEQERCKRAAVIP
ncbi:glutamate-rich protein 2 [Alosa alosa]|uniref:glutamate-rich protein 2 n=1 Tax=Alosa alosa TaxID=278164 RepID=UPI00201552B9|nr:glutamate-rich protein 2 [Alosa alosa]